MSGAVEKLIKTAIKAASDFRYHRGERATVEQNLSILEAEKGPLNPALRKQADDYAGDVLGWSGYAP
jgi:hypothetical protein